MTGTTTNDETVVQRTSRGTKNAFTGCFGFTKKSGDLTKLKYKETQIAGRKKLFGTQYFDLLAKKATDAELMACVEAAKADIKVIQDQIMELEEHIKKVDEETQGKIVKAPGTPKNDQDKPTEPMSTTTPTEGAKEETKKDDPVAERKEDPVPSEPAAPATSV
ncbi:predicted protein [Phaeodactylum tricornutum CCAP 1055/1]|jgi:hypothetical protein|uniref:Uncharacterized protein n=2 Tax=Phaeodactylum tricornutum TaxID=2850 RepID=B7FQ44_PHATC|nr:predicted protein [Phaeodactylum tricornutum CCAP 1055/1]EEC51279.1 predicted protein [Phaeodactylum tricornutum CCAP 1055/1]|mmetsp:Transcript_9471/g.24079  ORF Transcript_9471/g.24079 Transcript_9471/m.24079 type:complete len:163 (-) Transcript_9471:197-685(-)|eukprot:XP_002176816.1 predicted protein [Phaeodactylum tricornutum CCAP 1055/1]